MVTSGHMTKMAVTLLDLPYLKTPCNMHTSWLYVIESQLWPLDVLHCGTTFIYDLYQYSLEIHWMCKYGLPTSGLSKVICWQTDVPYV